MYGEYIIIDNYLSLIVSILIIVLVASFLTAQVWKKSGKILYIVCAICTILVIVNLVMYFAWPFI
jgi:hypothetical protein